MVLDKIDLQLLDLLQRDAALTRRELGEAVRLSPSAVHRRIARYRSEGLVTREVAVIDPRALGRQLAIVLVTLARGSAHDHAALRARLLATPEVQQCYDVAGEWDYVVVLVARDMRECRNLVESLFLQQQGINRVATLPVFDCVRLGLAAALRT